MWNWGINLCTIIRVSGSGAWVLIVCGRQGLSTHVKTFGMKYRIVSATGPLGGNFFRLEKHPGETFYHLYACKTLHWTYWLFH